ncbi:hypothetical protein [Cohnella mopanensis]|uniref:hypothetical protein n=1 Tax=Cohnella mopanensis TaxID=2911966 RepID=UPI001EF80592|nr:hypothetical protein [Cohnella mopanensis]
MTVTTITRMLKTKYLLVLLLSCVVSGCHPLIEKEKGGQSEARQSEAHQAEESTMDYVNIGDKQYINAWKLVVTDPSTLVEFGEVERGSRLPQGTPAYEIAGYTDRDIIAVKDDGGLGLVANTTGYSIYVWHEGAGQPSHYPHIPESQVERIKIYKGTKEIHTFEGEDVRSFLSLMNQPGPYNKFQTDQMPQYTFQLISDNSLAYQYGILEKNGRFGLAHIESELPAEIGRFFQE